MFTVAQMGARMHYAVPKILANAGLLESFFTDIQAPCYLRGKLGKCSARALPKSLRRWSARVPGIPNDKIRSFPLFGLEYALRLKLSSGNMANTATFLWAGREFCRRILQTGLGEARAVYTFNSAGLELLESARSRGLLTVMEQTIAPAEFEDDLLAAEEADFPGWEETRRKNPLLSELQERERAEWAQADIIVCGSDFVRKSVGTCGGPVERCRVVPYGIEPRLKINREFPKTRPLRVLTMGIVNLRKGVPYVLRASELAGASAHFRMVGQVSILPRARSLVTQRIELLGAVPRSEVSQHYEWADVFLLPSICEGSALVCYEALAAGLPVITTPNAGSVIRDGIDGYIVPIRSAEAIAKHIRSLARDRDLLAAMSENAVLRAREFTLTAYGNRLNEGLNLSASSKAMAASV